MKNRFSNHQMFRSRYLCSDFIYVVLFPQFVSVIHWPDKVDTYGCLAGYAVSVVMRVAGAVSQFNLHSCYFAKFCIFQKLQQLKKETI